MGKESKRSSRKSIVIRVDEKDKEGIDNLAKYYGTSTAGYCKLAVIHYSNLVLEGKQETPSIDFILNLITIKQAELLLEKLPPLLEKAKEKADAEPTAENGNSEEVNGEGA